MSSYQVPFPPSDHIAKGHVRVIIPLLIGWSILLNRNKTKYDYKFFDAMDIVRQILKKLHALHEANPFSESHWKGDKLLARLWKFKIIVPYPKPPNLFTWNAPPPNWIKFNTDGSRDHISGLGATGGIAGDSEGRGRIDDKRGTFCDGRRKENGLQLLSPDIIYLMILIFQWFYIVYWITYLNLNHISHYSRYIAPFLRPMINPDAILFGDSTEGDISFWSIGSLVSS